MQDVKRRGHDDVEAELAAPRGSDGELAFEVAGVEFELELERLAPGRYAVTLEAEKDDDDDEDHDEDDDDDDDEDGPDAGEYRFEFGLRDGLEDTFRIEVGGRNYLIDLEAGLEDEDDDDDDDDVDDDDEDDAQEAPDVVAEIEVKPLREQKWSPFEAELEIEAARGREVEGSLEYRGLEIGLELEPASARGRHYILEVELEDEKSGDVFEREFKVDTRHGFEREFVVRVGHRTFELEVEVERDREDDEILASLEIERLTRRDDDDDDDDDRFAMTFDDGRIETSPIAADDLI